MATINGTAGNDTLTGTQQADLIYGFAGNDTLKGLGGNDSLTGGLSNDILDGGLGSDTLNGGAGNDTYVLYETSAIDIITEAENSGIDTVQSSFNVTVGIGPTYQLGSNLEKLTLTGTSTGNNGTGNELNNTITGNAVNNTLNGEAGNDILNGAAGSDTLDGGLGSDTLNGGIGNDTYIIDSTPDTITETANSGTDTVQSSVSYTISSNLENLKLAGTASKGTGNSLNNAIVGNTANNILSGGAGNDTVDGEAGNRVLLKLSPALYTPQSNQCFHSHPKRAGLNLWRCLMQSSSHRRGVALKCDLRASTPVPKFG